MSNVKNLVQAVREHATAHCDEGGWDCIVECWSDQEILEVVEKHGATSTERAISCIAEYAALYNERRFDIQNA